MSSEDDLNLSANLGQTQTDDLELANQSRHYLSQSMSERVPSSKVKPDLMREAINTQEDSNQSMPNQVLIDLESRNMLGSELKPKLEPIASIKADSRTDS